MKVAVYVSLVALFFTSCADKSSKEVVKTSYYHTYGPEMKEKDFHELNSSGQVVEVRKDGVEVRRHYVDKKLHGECIWTYPYSEVVEKIEIYDMGKVISSGINFPNGSPEVREENPSSSIKTIRTWYEDGSPRFFEEWRDRKLQEGQYYTLEGNIDGAVVQGTGSKVERSSQGLMLERNRYVQGSLSVHEIFWPNGQLKESTAFLDGKKNGTQSRYQENGEPILIEEWKNDVLDGLSVYFDQGLRVSQIPYKNGKKDGTELHFRPGKDDVVEEANYLEGARHGLTKVSLPGHVVEEWYWKGRPTTEEQFKLRTKVEMPTKSS